MPFNVLARVQERLASHLSATTSQAMLAKPTPAVGDWLQAKEPGSGMKLKFHTRPPLASLLKDEPQYEAHQYRVDVQPRQYFGPIHMVSQDHPDYVSVLVPIRDGGLAWATIWGNGIHYCYLVKESTLAEWFRKGIQNQFVMESAVATEKERLQEMRKIHWRPDPCHNVYASKRRRTE